MKNREKEPLGVCFATDLIDFLSQADSFDLGTTTTQVNPTTNHEDLFVTFTRVIKDKNQQESRTPGKVWKSELTDATEYLLVHGPGDMLSKDGKSIDKVKALGNINLLLFQLRNPHNIHHPTSG